MSIGGNTNNGNKGQNQNNSQRAQQESTMGAAFANAGNQERKPDQGAFSFRNTGSLFTSPMGRNLTSEILHKLTKAMQAVLNDSLSSQFESMLIPIDRENNDSLSVSVLVVALQSKANPSFGVAYHTLILEGSTEPIQARTESINGQQVEIMRTVGDAFDPIMIRTVAEAVAMHFPQTKLLSADACVVLRDFKFDDPSAVGYLAINAAFAAATDLELQRPSFYDIDLSKANNDSSLTIRTTFGNSERIDAISSPVRADIAIELSAAPVNQGNNNGSFGIEKVSPVTRVDGFLDLIWDPAQVVQNIYAPQTPNFQKYSARFVITNLESAKLLTIPSQLLALVTTMNLRDNQAWVQALRQVHRQGGDSNMHDLGAIGIEVNFENNQTGYGARIDTLSDAFKPENLGKLVAATIKPDLFLSMDVPECGPQTWSTSVFAAAAENNANANQAIINAADHLTNGAFSRHFNNSNGRVAIDENNRIHLGYYEDKNGVRKDIRQIDYLAVLNRTGETDPVICRDWSDTYARTNYPLPIRLQARARIMQNLVPGIVFTGFARRVTFEPAFIDALAKACAECGLKATSISPYTDLGGYERATLQYGSYAMSSNDSVGLFNRNSFNNNQQNFGANRGFSNGRW
jgi:hypothetical protein